MRATIAILIAAAALALVPAGGSASAPRHPWATVNLCDTDEHPDEIGIRGDMPGLARRSRMYMRFRVQYRTLSGSWRVVPGTAADSGWTRVAAGRRGHHDAGWTFDFLPPRAGGAHVLRGLVTYQWRRGHKVVRRDRRVTEAGHPGTAGSDPTDFSADSCEIA
jgi:hypothetical protein